MGGSTGRTKDNIIIAMYRAEQHGSYVTVTELAKSTKLTLSTISEHLHDLKEKIGHTQESENLRGRWELTDKGRNYAQRMLPPSNSIEYHGVIAAGPAVPIMEGVNEPLNIEDLDPAQHFAMHVRGDSMVSYGILDGDLVIFRRVNTWLEVREGQIVAARVPEGTGIDTGDWIESLDWCSNDEEAQMPALDHVTLKRFDAKLRTYIHQGNETQRPEIQLHGSNGTLRPTAVAIAGVLVRAIRDY